jgi:nucleoside-diphosphate-sugar epimerase
MPRVAVVGANGFIGSRTVEMLHLGGYAEVRPIVRSHERLGRPARFDLDCRIADAFQQDALTAAFNSCDVVVHAVAGDSRTIRGTVAPAYHAAEKAGVQRFIYLSSASVHGQAPAPGTDEKSQLSGGHLLPYNKAKIEAERTLWALRRQGGVELVILRPSIVFGPRSVWITSFVEALLADQAYLVNQGRGICNTAYVDNVVHAIYLAMTTPDADGEVFLITDQEKITWSEFYQPFAEALGFNLGDVHSVDPVPFAVASGSSLATLASNAVRKAISYLPADAKIAMSTIRRLIKQRLAASSPWKMPEAPKPRATLELNLLQQCNYKLPTRKARAMLGYEPLVSFAEGCQRTISWLAFVGYPIVQQGTQTAKKKKTGQKSG